MRVTFIEHEGSDGERMNVSPPGLYTTLHSPSVNSDPSTAEVRRDAAASPSPPGGADAQQLSDLGDVVVWEKSLLSP